MRKLFVHFGVVAALALSLAGGGAIASARAADTLIKHFTPELVTEMLKEFGATDVKVETQDGTAYIEHKHGEFTFVFSLLACQKGEPGCRGLAMTKAFAPDDGKPFQLTQVNSFNAEFVFAQAYIFEQNLYLVRYTISDDGVTRGNVRANVETFWEMPNVFTEHYLSNVVSQAPSVMRPVAYPNGAQPAPAFARQIGVEKLRRMPKDKVRRR
jgi:hypothetical protein